MVFALIPLMIVGGIVALIVRFVANRGDGPEAGGDAVRRFFQYALLLSVVSIVATGVTDLLAEVIPGERLLRSGSNAGAVSYLIIGGPVLYGLIRWVARSLEDDDERRSLGWALYVTAAGITALITAAVSLFQVGEAILRIDEFDPTSLARAIVWTLVWFIHWRLSADQDHDHRLWLHVFLGSGIGLGIAAISIGGLINSAISAIYESAF